MPAIAQKIMLILALLALAAFGWFYWPTPPSYIPQGLWGLWKTDHPAYADRYLDISEAIFTIGQGNRRMEVFFVRHVDLQPVGPRTQYTLHYTDANNADQALQTFTFSTEATPDGLRLQLKNQPNIFWYQESPPRQALPEAVQP